MLFLVHFFAAKNSMSFALRVFHFLAWGTGKYVRSLMQPLLIVGSGLKSHDVLYTHSHALHVQWVGRIQSHKVHLRNLSFQGMHRMCCQDFIDCNSANEVNQ